MANGTDLLKTTAQGASAGGAIGGPIGAAVGAGAGLLVGGAQLTGAGKAKKESEALAPPLQDVNRVRALEEARRRQRQIESGADPSTQANLIEADQLTSGTQRAIARNTGGDVGGTVSGLLQSQRLGGRNVNRVFAQAAPRQQFFQGLQDQISQQVSQRTLDLSQFRSQQKSALSAQRRKEGFANAAAGAFTGAPLNRDQFGSVFNSSAPNQVDNIEGVDFEEAPEGAISPEFSLPPSAPSLLPPTQVIG